MQNTNSVLMKNPFEQTCWKKKMWDLRQHAHSSTCVNVLQQPQNNLQLLQPCQISPWTAQNCLAVSLPAVSQKVWTSAIKLVWRQNKKAATHKLGCIASPRGLVGDKQPVDSKWPPDVPGLTETLHRLHLHLRLLSCQIKCGILWELNNSCGIVLV